MLGERRYIDVFISLSIIKNENIGVEDEGFPKNM